MRTPIATRTLVTMAVWLVACASSDDERPSEARCRQLRDRVIEHRLAGLPLADQASHRAALSTSLGDGFVERCQQLSMAQVNCAFAAKDSASVAACSSR